MFTQLKESVLLTERKPDKAGQPQADLRGSVRMRNDSSSGDGGSDDGQAMFVLFMEP